MPLEILIAQWVAIFWLICGLSHALHPAKWGALLLPLRERDTGGFIPALMSLPVGLVIITVVGWMATFKSVIYLLFRRAHVRVMSSPVRVEKGIRIADVVMMVLGALSQLMTHFIEDSGRFA